MRIKKIVKMVGKLFIALEQKDERIIRQCVLVVDNGYSWLGHLNSAIERIKNYFPKAEISVMTFEQRKSNLEKDFPTLKFVLPSQELRPKRYRLALQLLKMRKESYDSVILFSLDITPLVIALFFHRSKIILYNQWGQWWCLKLRSITEFFRISYVKKKARFNFKNLLKRIGLFFILIQREDEEALKHSVLLVDDGRAVFEHAGFFIPKIRETLPYAKISILAMDYRVELFKKVFPDVEIITAHNFIIKKYRIFLHMLRLRKKRYNYIILLSLDITPIIASILFMNSKVILYNQWHQWWTLKPKSIRGHLMILPHFIFNIIIFAYLLISVSLIFLRRAFNVFSFRLLGRRT